MATINLILIHLMIVYVLDISGFVDDGIQPFFIKHFKHRLKSKPYLCSRCQSLWIGLAYILIVGKFTIPYIALCMLLSFLAPLTNTMLLSVYDLIARLFE